jgi:hypothetical protein
MAEYTVTDSKTGREITFEWNDTKPPTQQDMLSVFAEANRQTKPITNPHTEQKIMSTEPSDPKWAGDYPNAYGMYGALRELYKTVGKPAIETAGMVGGGIIGAGSGFLGGAGLGAIPGGAMGAGLGYAGARNLTGALDQKFDIDRGINITPQKVVKSTIKDLALGALGGNPIQKEATTVIPKTIRKVSPEFRAVGGEFSPAEATDSRTLSQIESLLEQVPFASDVTAQWRESSQLKPLFALKDRYVSAGLENTPKGQQLAAKIQQIIGDKVKLHEATQSTGVNALRDLGINKMGASDSIESLMRTAQEAASGKSKDAVRRKNDLFRDIESSVPKGELEFKNYLSESQNQMDELVKLPNADSELMNILKWGTKSNQNPEEAKVIEAISNYTSDQKLRESMLKQAGIENIPTGATKEWITMQNHRNQLTDIIKGASKPNNNPAMSGQMDDVQRRAKLLRDAIDQDFKSIAETTGGDALDKWNIANAYYSKEYAPIWKQKTIQDMARKNPSELINSVIKPGSTVEIGITKKALGEEAFDSTVKPAFTNKILGAGRDEQFNPAKLKKTLNDYGDETLLNIYRPDELNTLKNIADTGEIILSKKLPNEAFLKNIIRTEPNIVIRSMIGSIDKMPSSKDVLNNVSILKKYLPETEMQGLNIEFLENVFKTNPVTGYVEPVTLGKNVNKYQDAIRVMMGEEKLNGLKSLARTMDIMARAQQMSANPSGTAKNVIAFGASNEIIFKPLETALKGDILKAAGQAIVGVTSKVLGAKTLAKLYFSPKGRELITKAFTTQRNTKEGAELAKKITIVLGNEYLSDTEQ